MFLSFWTNYFLRIIDKFVYFFHSYYLSFIFRENNYQCNFYELIGVFIIDYENLNILLLSKALLKQCFFVSLKYVQITRVDFFRDFFIGILNGCNFKKCLLVFFMLILLLNETKHCSRAVFFFMSIVFKLFDINFLFTDATFINCHAS